MFSPVCITAPATRVINPLKGLPRGIYGLLMIVFMFVIGVGETLAQNVDDFRSVQSGDWSAATTWNRWNGTAWVTPAGGPLATSSSIRIRATHSVTVNAPITTTGVIVEQSGFFIANAAVTITNGPAAMDFEAQNTSNTVVFTETSSLTVAAGAVISGPGTPDIQVSTQTVVNNGFINLVMITAGSAGPINISGTGSITSLFIGNAPGVTLGSDHTILGSLVFQNGNLVTGTNHLVIGPGGEFQQAGGTNHWVEGNVRLMISVGTTYDRNVVLGDPGGMAEVFVSLHDITVAGYFDLKTTVGDHFDVANSGLNPLKSVNRYWTFNSTGSFGVAEFGLHWGVPNIDFGADWNVFNVAQFHDGNTWNPLTVSGRTNTSINFGLFDFHPGDNQVAVGELLPCDVNIPDPQLKAALINLGIDTNGDAVIQCSEAAAFTGSLDLSSKGITNVQGIKAFSNADFIDLTGNNIITADFSGMTNLSTLVLDNNAGLNNLTINGCSGMHFLSARSTQLAAVNFGDAPALNDVDVSLSRLAGTVDLSANPLMRTFNGIGNQITGISFATSSDMQSINIYNNPISALDVSNLANLNYLVVNSTQITTLDLSNNHALQTLIAFNGVLTSVNIQNGNNSNLTTFNVTGNPGLACIQVDNVAFMNANFSTFKDAGTTFSLNCSGCFVKLNTVSGANLYICREEVPTVANVQLLITGGFAPFTITGSDTTNLSDGTYYYQVKDALGCIARDTVTVLHTDCIVPYYAPPADDTTNALIGAELTQLFNYPSSFVDTTRASSFFLIRPPATGSQDTTGSVLIEVIATVDNYQSLLALLQTPQYGLTDIVDNGDTTLIITGFLPIKNLPKLNLLINEIQFVRPYFTPIANGTGLTMTQGDTAMMSDKARKAWKVSGKGIKVGVLSDSYNTIANNPAGRDVDNEDLPGITNPNYRTPVNVVAEYPYGRRTDEGRAMLQIVHDVAPDASLMFHSGFVSAGNFADGIRKLRDAGCDVIVDDITYITEPFFKDGVIAHAVDDVTSTGVSYFTSAGNFGEQSYEGVFAQTTAPDGYLGVAHNFGGGDVYQDLSLEAGDYTIALQWDDEFYSLGTGAGATHDLDIYVVDKFGNRKFGFNRNNLGEDPVEILPFQILKKIDAKLIVTMKGGDLSHPVRFKYIIFRGDGKIVNHIQNTGTVIGQANAAGSIAVGAVLYKNTPAYGVPVPTVASFSSRGGITVNGSNRNKPDITAPNGVNTTVNFGGVNIDDDNFPNFFGTSAAAPHAAAVAALLLEQKHKVSADSTLTGDQVRTVMQASALPLGNAGGNEYQGNGFLQADAALQYLANPFPLVDTVELMNPAITPGQQPVTVVLKGAYFRPNAKVIFRYDTLQPVITNSQQLTVTLPAFQGNPPLAIYNPPMLSNGIDGGVSDSIYLLTARVRNVKITVNDAIKRFGEKIPVYSSVVTVDGLSLADAQLSLDSLGLTDLQYFSTATSIGNVGQYYRRAKSAVTDLSNPRSLYLSKLYNYNFTDGLLTINRMPVTITPRDTVVTYGNALKGRQIRFNYTYAPDSIEVSQRGAFLDSLNATHQATMSNNMILINSKMAVNGQPLTAADFLNMSFMTTGNAASNSKQAVNSKMAVNGTVRLDTTYYVPLAPESIFEYQVDSANGVLHNSKMAVNSKQAVNSNAAVNSKMAVNGIASVNNIGVVNSKMAVNSKQAVNSASFNDESNENVLLIVDSTDVYGTTDSLTGFQSMNMVTGYTVGNWLIGPGVLISENFDISYGIGHLTVVPETLTVTAKDTTAGCGGVRPTTYNNTKFPYQFEDADSNVVASGPVYTLKTNAGGSVPAGNLAAGTYKIVPSGITFQDAVPNYTIVYQDGVLTVAPPPAAPVISVVNNCGSSTLSSAAAGAKLWSTGATTSSITVTTNGTYTLRTTVNNCTSAAASTTVTLMAAPAAPTVSIQQPTCAAPAGSITVTSSKTGLMFSINGSAFSSTSTFNNLPVGSYSIVAKNSTCSSAATTVNILAGSCASIGNQVFSDLNSNGIQDSGEPGINGVTVKLYGSTGTLLATTTTANNGLYAFTNLNPGTYSVGFTTPSGYTPALSNVGSDDSKDSDPVSGTAGSIVLASGMANTSVDAGFMKYMSLGNRVFYDANNDGMNNLLEAGMSNITVRLYKDANNDNIVDGAAIATSTTNLLGLYLFQNLIPGNYIVGVVVPAGYVSSASNGGDPDNNVRYDDNGQVLVGNEIRGLAITLRPGTEPDGIFNTTDMNITYDFGLLPDCNCVNTAGNLLVNGSFENGTTGWIASGGKVTAGTGYGACGPKNGNNESGGRASLVYQDVTVAPGASVTLSGFAGTHILGLFGSPKISLIFRNASGIVLRQVDVNVTQNLDLNWGQLAYYTITGTAPAGTAKVRVQSSISLNTMRLDALCLRVFNNSYTTRGTGIGEESVDSQEPADKGLTAGLAVSVSPNPTNNFFNLSINSSDRATPVTIRIRDVSGRLVVNQQSAPNSNIVIRAEKWTGGMYFIELSQGAERKVLKVMKTN